VDNGGCFSLGFREDDVDHVGSCGDGLDVFEVVAH